MKFSTVFLLATTCLAADNSSMSAPNAKQLQPSGIRATVIDIGFELGTSTELVIKKTSDKKKLSLLVSAKKLEEVVMLKWNDKEDSRGFDPFAELFNCNCLLEKLSEAPTMMSFQQTQFLFIECSRIPEAKIAIDVAVLKWLSGGIQDVKSNDSNQKVDVEPDILSPLCALSLDPDDKSFNYTRDILIVLTQVQELIAHDSLWFLLGDKKGILLSLLTVMKLFDEGPIWTKAREITTTLVKEDYQKLGPILELTMGSDDALEESIELDVKKGADWNAKLGVQSALKRKVHSLAFLPCLNPADFFILTFGTFSLKADISTGGALEWESTQASKKEMIALCNQRKVNSQMQLLIMSKMEPPASLFEEITSCASLSKFYELLKKPAIKQMILSYGVTILETENLFFRN